MIRTSLFCCTTASLFGCTSAPIVHEPIEVELVRYETVQIPAILLVPCTVTLGDLKSNSDLELATAAALTALKLCNEDKAAIRALE